MAFNNLGTPVWIAPGGTQDWWYTWHDDRGAQVATAHVIDLGQVVQAVAQGEERDARGFVVYSVRFTNEGPYGCSYNLQGGGLT